MMTARRYSRLCGRSSGSHASGLWRPIRSNFGSMARPARRVIWIDPPWRLSLAGRFITGSADWPVWDGVEEPKINQPLWEAWCALLDPLNRTTLVKVSVGSPQPDLALEFESGHRIETFGNSSDGYWWYYRDRESGEVFEVAGSGITHEWVEVPDAEPKVAPDCGGVK